MPEKVLGLITYNPETGLGQKEISEAIANYTGMQQQHAIGQSYFRQFENIVTNISVKDDYRRSDYEYFRPSERIPTEIHAIISSCMDAYRRVGIVRNIIDLMADFSVKGVQLMHPNPQIQKFYRGWFEKVGGTERSERFLNLLYRSGNVPVKRTFGKINEKYIGYLRSLAKEEDLPIEKMEVDGKGLRYVIPVRYDFLNPVNIYVAGGELSHFVGKTLYTLNVPLNIINKIRSPQTQEEKELIKEIPKAIYQRITQGQNRLPLGSENFSMYFWKKDDWAELAEPLIFCIFDSLLLLQKMQLADLAALDGAISQIRVWRLGNLDKNLFPTSDAVTKLAEILMSNPGGGAFDLIWGPDLEVEEVQTTVHQFLGKAKYEPVLEAIYSGLGVPPTLTGTANAAGTTNNFISLKTLTERLEYGRQILVSFWNNEIRLVQKAMGFRFPATIDFDRTVLSDEAATKALYIQLVDRNYISEETFLERFGECDELEMLRKRREEKEREKGSRVARGGPWMTLEKEYELLKTFVQKGMVTPNGAELDVDAKDFIDPRKLKPQGSSNNGSNKGTGGRPFNANDKGQRSRNYKIRTSADAADFVVILAWAKDALNKITEIVQKPYLNKYGKSDVRSLSHEQFDGLENLKYYILCSLEPFTEITAEIIGKFILSDKLINEDFYNLYSALYEESKKKKNADLTIDECRLIRATAYSVMV